ncbi:hypothetical protein ACQ4PT_047857 [Festuca glaucescens]
MVHQREQKSLAKKNHIASQTNMITITSRDPILVTIEKTAVMLIMVPKKGEMTTLPLEIKRRSTWQISQDSRSNMMRIRRGDHLLLMIEMTTMILIMVQKSVMTTQLPEREWRTTVQNHQDNQKNMRTIRGDPILMMVERTTVMLITIPEKGEMTTQLPEI